MGSLHRRLDSFHHLYQLYQVSTSIVEDRHADGPRIHRLYYKLYVQIA